MTAFIKPSCVRASVRAATLGLATGLCVAAGGTFARAEPVALVLDRSEGVDVGAFTELVPGDVIDLGTGGHIDLLNYGACQEVRIKSGVLSVTSNSWSLDGGQEQVLRNGNCLQAESGSGTVEADKGLTVTMRSLEQEDKAAASLMLRFDEQLRADYDSVFVSVEGGEPKRFDALDTIMTQMPERDAEDQTVEVELFFQGKAPDYGVAMRKFTINPAEVGRNTAVVVVK